MITVSHLLSAARQLLVTVARNKADPRALGRSRRALLLVVFSYGALLGIGAAPAVAKVTHNVEGNFNASETPGGSFGFLVALSVDNSTGPSAGDVYAGGLSFSTFSGYVYKFDANGKYSGVELNGSETPGGSFAFVSLSTERGSRGLAVDSSSGANKGDVYVADAEHLVIDRFSESGKFLCEITGREYASLSSAEQAAECAGSAGSKTPQGGFTEGSNEEAVLGVAVNPVNGDVYASDPGHAAIDEFNEAGEYIGQISDSHIAMPGSLAFNSTGELYVDSGGGLTSTTEVVKFDAGNSFVAVLASGAASYVAVNPSNNSVFVLNGNLFGENETAEYDSSGNLNSKFGQRESGAIGVSASSGRIYIGPLNSGSVSMYGPAVVIPDVAATAATEVAQFTATPNGEVDPAGGGSVESCEFEYGTSTSYGQTAPCSPATPYAGVTNVSASLSALSPKTTYHFRVAASNSNGVVSYSSDRTFATSALEVTGQATNLMATGATLNGTVNPDGATITDCHFEYGTTTSYGHTQPCASTPSGSSPVAVSADIAGLAENTTYHFRLVAAYSDGSSSGSTAGLDEMFATLSRPLIHAAYTSNLSSGSVDLNAQINPMGLDTTYYFEWGTEVGNYTHTELATDIGSGTSDVPVTQRVSGLSANTTYHWRVVATNSTGSTVGQDRTFIYQTTTPSGAGCSNEARRVEQASMFLPDCRAYEQVSPVDKNNSDVKDAFHGDVSLQVSVDGERVFYEAAGAFPGALEAIENSQYLASRGASGWSTRAVDLPLRATHVPGGGQVGYSLPLSPDLSSGLLVAEPALVAGAPGPEIWNLYVGHLPTGSYELVTDVNPPNQKGANFAIQPGGASTDFSHVIFMANDALTPEAPVLSSLDSNLYEWVEGQLRLVSLIPTSGTSCTAAECIPAAGGAEPGGRNSATPNLDAHAISADGSRIVFSTGAKESEKHIYDRLNGTTTVDVSASQRTTPEPGTAGAHYQDASVDGSHVLFTSEAALTNDAVPGSGANLYDYDVETGQLTDLTAADDARVQWLAGLSEDASHVYFVAKGVLAANSNSHGDTAVPGQPNLYLWSGGQTTFIATTYITEERQEQPTRVTPDGSHFAFESVASLTGYDNTDANTGEPDLETFLYDAAANRLICVSCNPSGARPVGPSELHWLGSALYRPRNLSADGSRLFFTSRDALLPSDTNGLSNVYEWEADGSGSCRSSVDNGGCLYLISGGSGASNSYFADASPSGNDLFFTTGDSLVGQDQDSYTDLYDARVGGGFASQGNPVVAPACTSLEGCRSPLSEPPAQFGVASAELHGPGNLVAPPEAPEGKQVKKKVKKQHKKRRQKKHQKKRRVANNHRRAGR